MYPVVEARERTKTREDVPDILAPSALPNPLIPNMLALLHLTESICRIPHFQVLPNDPPAKGYVGAGATYALRYMRQKQRKGPQSTLERILV